MGKIPNGASVEQRLLNIGWDVDENGCWVWRGSKNKQGYGYVKIEGKRCRVSRVSYELWVGTIPENHVVMHVCDNTPCMKPSHLTTGTQKENGADMQAKGLGALLTDHN